MEYSNSEKYLLNLYVSLTKVKGYDKFRIIYENIMELYNKKEEFLFTNIIRTLNFYYAVSFKKEVNENTMYTDFLTDEDYALDLIIYFYSKIIIKDEIMNLADDKLKKLIFEVRSLNDFLRYTLMELFSVTVYNNEDDPFSELELFLNNEVVTDNEFVNEKLNILYTYKYYLTNIIYTDLYEHMSLNSDEDVTETKEMVKYIILNRNNFETEVLLRKEILKLYITLNMKNYKRKEAREKFSEDDFALIRKINPLYKLDS